MRPSAEFGLKCATIAAAALGYLSLTTTYLYGPPLFLLPLAAAVFMPIGERLDRRFKAYRHVTNLIIYVYIALFAVIAVRFSFLDAVLSLVMFIQVYAFIHVKRPRHYAYILLMSFFLLWAAVTESPRPDIAFVLFLYVFALGWALTRLEMHIAQTAVMDSGLPDAAARIHSLVAGRSPRSARLRFPLIMSGVAAAASAMGGGFFFFGPRTEAGVFGASPPRIRPTTGVSSQISLLTAGALQADMSPVMRVQFPDEPDGQFGGTMLWRVAALDAYTGVGWEHRGVSVRTTRRIAEEETHRFASDWRMASREGLDRLSEDDWPLVHQEIYLDHPPTTAVPALQTVKTIIPRDNPEDYVFRWDVAGDFSAIMTARTDSGVYLDVWSEMIQPTPASLRQAGTNYEAAMTPQDFRNLTDQNLLPETIALVRSITANRPTVYDKVRALNAHLSGSEYLYSTVIPKLPAENPIDAFILREKRGHCELYASALALMVRSLGVPARVVSGYRDGLWNASDRSYTVTNDMAHLWAEVYFPGVGWISFDPSPLGDGEMALIDRFSRELSRNLLKARMLWLRYVVGFRPEEQQIMLQDLAAQFVRTAGDTWDAIRESDSAAERARRGRGIVVLAAMAAALIGSAYLVWRQWSRRPRLRVVPLSPDQRRAVRLRGRIVQALRRWGISSEGKTAEELAQNVAALRLNDPAAAQTIIEAYNYARFGNRPMSAAAYANWLRRLRAVKRLQPER